MRKKILISYVFVALLVTAYSLTKSDKISYKFTYINQTQNTMGKSNKCYVNNSYYFCEFNGQKIRVEEFYY